MPKTKSPYDLKFRPDSYWNHDDPLQEILAGISGTARRQMLTDFWDAGQFDKLEEGLLEDDLDEETRERLGAFHPFFMGGEYLPQRFPGEVSIVRIQLESTTFDVIELRARPISKGRIGLRWVDEYESSFDPPAKTIGKPFSFKQLIAYIKGTGFDSQGNLPHVYNEMNYKWIAGETEEVENLRSFTSFSSDFYPQLATWADEQINAWFDEQIEEAMSSQRNPG